MSGEPWWENGKAEWGIVRGVVKGCVADVRVPAGVQDCAPWVSDMLQMGASRGWSLR